MTSTKCEICGFTYDGDKETKCPACESKRQAAMDAKTPIKPTTQAPAAVASGSPSAAPAEPPINRAEAETVRLLQQLVKASEASQESLDAIRRRLVYMSIGMFVFFVVVILMLGRA